MCSHGFQGLHCEVSANEDECQLISTPVTNHHFCREESVLKSASTEAGVSRRTNAAVEEATTGLGILNAVSV